MAAADPRSPVCRTTPLNFKKGKSVDTRSPKGLSMGRHAALDVARRGSINMTRAI